MDKIKKFVLSTLLIIFLTSGFASVTQVSAATGLYYDGFNDATSDGWQDRWILGDLDANGNTIGDVHVDTVNHRLIVTVTDSTVTQDPAWGFWLKLKASEDTLQGNFLLQIKYELINWGGSTVQRVGLGHVASDGTHWLWNTHQSEGGQTFFVDAYGSFTNVSPRPTSTETSGLLRVIRDGGITSAYFKDASHDWTYIGQSNQGTDDLYAQFMFWGARQTFSGKNFQVAFDDFYAISGTNFMLPTIQSCDQFGNLKDTFNLGEPVAVKGTGYDPLKTYNVYLVDDTEWTEGMSIPSRVTSTTNTITTQSDGTLGTPVIYSNPAPGKYDIIIDVNANGLYDSGIDTLLNNQVEVTAGIFVLPEYAYGALLALIACFAAFIIIKKPRLNR
ncbi:MAG: hypothetical protein NWE92_13030 [Candidatus Bathyarchaeota archaeon]|nr:hypothetical protein [Candidatus Bathyarchaeota archaeon]